MIPSARSFSMICFRLCKSAVSTTAPEREGAKKGEGGRRGSICIWVCWLTGSPSRVSSSTVFAFRTDTNYSNWINFPALCRLICREWVSSESVCECLPVSVVLFLCVCECIKICRNFLNDREIIMMPQVFVSFCHSKLRSLASRTLRGNGVACPEWEREGEWGVRGIGGRGL